MTITLYSGENTLDVYLQEPVEVPTVGIILVNPPVGATHWKWIAQQGYKIRSSENTPIEDIAYARSSISLPAPLVQVMLWHMEGDEYIIDDSWEGSISINDYGNYELDWEDAVLTKVGS